MKNFKKILLPALIALAGAGSAYATHPAENEGKAPVQGYAFHPGETVQCVNSGKQCDTNGTIICTADLGMGPEPLYQLNGTSCSTVLKERIVK